MAEDLHRIDHHRPKTGLNPKKNGYSISLWTGTNINSWFYGENKSSEKVPAFRKSHTRMAETRKKLKKINVEMKFTALLLKSIHFRLHCYTLAGAVVEGCNPSLSPGRAPGTVPSSVDSASIPAKYTVKVSKHKLRPDILPIWRYGARAQIFFW